MSGIRVCGELTVPPMSLSRGVMLPLLPLVSLFKPVMPPTNSLLWTMPVRLAAPSACAVPIRVSENTNASRPSGSWVE